MSIPSPMRRIRLLCLPVLLGLALLPGCGPGPRLLPTNEQTLIDRRLIEYPTAVLLTDGRLYFGVGTATNSGVVGIDDWNAGWVKDHPKTCDRSYVDLKLHGRRFDTPNPAAGLLGGSDIAVTGPFQPFGTSNQTLIPKDPNDKPNGAIYTVNPLGGGVRVFAHGLHNPRGLAWHEYRLYATNDGMELRGTRPVMNDPDVLLWITPDTWYGWPDFSADLMPISDPRFPPTPL